ncbi:MAG: ADP-dependent NAD(P)H-hydrate dehydratase / NAD(P)H-hydrate epimerase, partial [Candidatus Hydrogenedentes bacterium]|nr:ADP-dependent NAD(P)H-hydrate dehydratase / NAD(P)H-hydrate epimerase [Candidatus Hydrogenedentota bacterium]
ARSGVGLVTVGVPAPLIGVIAAVLDEPMTLPLPSTEAESVAALAVDPALSFAADKDAVVLGPGLSQHPETRTFVRDFVRRCGVPMLIDADGLNNLTGCPEILRHPAGAPRVVTPHPGEMARLAVCSTRDVQTDREGIAARFAAAHGCVVVLKGHGTIVADASGRVLVNTTGNPGMATGGSGDVLSGLIGGLMAQRMEAFDAAVLGVYLHGLAGDIAAERMTQRGLIAGDIVWALCDAWRAVEEGG